ncbi:transcription factor FAMA-like isoform X2 [Chenopodium quinoa]|uniref:transcription factor FAMA-like isoform X2 n=1 Tax=Chenopodium quinoa TaxID=63459 RepID=UPI000B76C7F7|nr:transcription factor FAMA-like isoform X2 [Chenopodium quinoa]
MQREEINYEAATEAGGRFSANVDDSSATNNNSLLPYHQPHGSGSVMVDYMLSNPPPDLINNGIPSRTAYHSERQQQQHQHQHQQPLLLDQPNINMDRTLSFADVMQFADFGPKLALNHPRQHHDIQENSNADQEDDHTITGIDPVYFLKFPVLSNSHMVPGHNNTSSIHDDSNTPTNNSINDRDGGFGDPLQDFRDREYGEDAAAATAGVLSTSTNNLSNPVQLEFLGNATNDDNNLMGLSTGERIGAEGGAAAGTMGHNNKSSSSSSKRKRPRSIKTNEEVESQRMTHIAVERNRRKQMNEHLRVLRSLMPSSYVQRGDQASIIGGAIEFVRELEQLLQCLESQKRRRLYGDQPRAMGDSSTSSSSTALGLVQQTPQVQPPLAFPPPMGTQYHHQDDDQLRLLDHQLDPMATPTPTPAGLLREETAESKSCFADVEVKVLGFDALIKILSRRRHGQLIKAIAALEDLHFTILHTNITTIEQTVLYSFNVKVANEARFTAEDIAASVQQIFTFIHANTNII